MDTSGRATAAAGEKEAFKDSVTDFRKILYQKPTFSTDESQYIYLSLYAKFMTPIK